MPRPSSSSLRTASTLSRMVVSGKRGPWKRLGGVAGAGGPAVAEQLGHDQEVLPGVERPAVADQPVVAVALRHVVRGQQDGVVLRGVERAVGAVDDHRPGEGDAALELEALDGERARRGSGLLGRLRCASSGCEQSKHCERNEGPGLGAHRERSFPHGRPLSSCGPRPRRGRAPGREPTPLALPAGAHQRLARPRRRGHVAAERLPLGQGPGCLRLRSVRSSGWTRSGSGRSGWRTAARPASSPTHGLVMTNHHCVRDCVQDLSTSKDDYLDEGLLRRGPEGRAAMRRTSRPTSWCRSPT